LKYPIVAEVVLVTMPAMNVVTYSPSFLTM